MTSLIRHLRLREVWCHPLCHPWSDCHSLNRSLSRHACPESCFLTCSCPWTCCDPCDLAIGCVTVRLISCGLQRPRYDPWTWSGLGQRWSGLCRGRRTWTWNGLLGPWTLTSSESGRDRGRRGLEISTWNETWTSILTWTWSGVCSWIGIGCQTWTWIACCDWSCLSPQPNGFSVRSARCRPTFPMLFSNPRSFRTRRILRSSWFCARQRT